MTATWSPGLSSKVGAFGNSAVPTLAKAQAQNNTAQVKSGFMLVAAVELYASNPTLANTIRPAAVKPMPTLAVQVPVSAPAVGRSAITQLARNLRSLDHRVHR